MYKILIVEDDVVMAYGLVMALEKKVILCSHATH